MNCKLVIFDMDGTTLDTLVDLKNSINAALQAHGLPPRSLDEVRRFVGNGIQKLVERAVPAGTAPEVTAQVYAAFTAHYQQHCADTTRPYDGILELLNTLKKAGYLLATVSNKADYAVKILCEQYFAGLFDAAIGEKTGVRKKPAPDTVNQVLQELNVDKAQAVYVGDSDVDIETARNAGMPCISVAWGFRDVAFLQAHGAGKIVSAPGELLGCLVGQ